MSSLVRNLSRPAALQKTCHFEPGLMGEKSALLVLERKKQISLFVRNDRGIFKQAQSESVAQCPALFEISRRQQPSKKPVISNPASSGEKSAFSCPHQKKHHVPNSARILSTRLRFTPKSRTPRREAERTWITPAFSSSANSTSST